MVFGGFPLEGVARDYPQAQKTVWGYQLIGRFNTDNYGSWLLQHKQAAKAVANAVTAVVPSCTVNVQGGTTAHKNDIVQKVNEYCLLLSEQQMEFLLNLNWQVAHSLTEQDICFMNGLKQLAVNHKVFFQNC